MADLFAYIDGAMHPVLPLGPSSVRVPASEAHAFREAMRSPQPKLVSYAGGAFLIESVEESRERHGEYVVRFRVAALPPRMPL